MLSFSVREKICFAPVLLLLGLTVSVVGQPMVAATSCHSIVLTGELQAGDLFEKVIGGDLVIRLEPEILGPHGDLHGWQISLAPSHEPDRDYIYPVNPPLRFNGLQTLGPGYGDDTKTAMAISPLQHEAAPSATLDRALRLTSLKPLHSHAKPFGANNKRREQQQEKFGSRPAAVTTLELAPFINPGFPYAMLHSLRQVS